METLTFYSRFLNTKVDVDILLKSYINDCLPELRTAFNLDDSIQLKMFVINKQGRPKIFNSYSDISYVTHKAKDCRHIEVVWTTPKSNSYGQQVQHGKQVQDLSPSNIGTVVSGYKRMVSANPNAGGAFIGDPNGASVFIPAGALGPGTESREISIKTIMVDNSKINLPSGSRNVTREVISDSNKVNKEVNGW